MTAPAPPGRDSFSLAGVPRDVALALIKIYQILLSPALGRNCRFTPSCSRYAAEAIDRFGVIRGGWLAVRRLGRCHPFHEPGFDPVPPRQAGAGR